MLDQREGVPCCHHGGPGDRLARDWDLDKGSQGCKELQKRFRRGRDQTWRGTGSAHSGIQCPWL